jgi:hypothetical protein
LLLLETLLLLLLLTLLLLLLALLLLLLAPLFLHLLLALLLHRLLTLLLLLLLFEPALFHRLPAVILLLESAIASHGIARLGTALLEWLSHSAPARVSICGAHIGRIGIVAHTISRCTDRTVTTSCIRLARGVDTPVATRTNGPQTRVANILTTRIPTIVPDIASRTDRPHPVTAALAFFHGPHKIRSPVATRTNRPQTRVANILTTRIPTIVPDIASRTDRPHPVTAANGGDLLSSRSLILIAAESARPP